MRSSTALDEPLDEDDCDRSEQRRRQQQQQKRRRQQQQRRQKQRQQQHLLGHSSVQRGRQRRNRPSLTSLQC